MQGCTPACRVERRDRLGLERVVHVASCPNYSKTWFPDAPPCPDCHYGHMSSHRWDPASRVLGCNRPGGTMHVFVKRGDKFR